VHRGAVAYSLRLGLLAACVLAACACGASAKPLSGEHSLSPGNRYVTDEFEPALTFEVGNGWELTDGLQQKPFFELSREYQGGDRFVVISFNNPPPGSATLTILTSLCPHPKIRSPGSKGIPTSKSPSPGRRASGACGGGASTPRSPPCPRTTTARTA
jgi:hypothetical protein